MRAHRGAGTKCRRGSALRRRGSVGRWCAARPRHALRRGAARKHACTLDPARASLARLCVCGQMRALWHALRCWEVRLWRQLQFAALARWTALRLSGQRRRGLASRAQCLARPRVCIRRGPLPGLAGGCESVRAAVASRARLPGHLHRAATNEGCKPCCGGTNPPQFSWLGDGQYNVKTELK